MNVAIVGAGLSGLTCARTLTSNGHRVSVFEKARGPGGRMSTRRADERRFDHGAQYFTVRDARFEQFLAPLADAGVVARWDARIADLERGASVAKHKESPRFVGVPGMSAICRELAKGLQVQYGTRVHALVQDGAVWRVHAEDARELGAFDAVVVSAPAPQTADLLATAAPTLAKRAASVSMSACWAVMAAFSSPLDVTFDGAFVHNSPLSWVARDASKPSRPDHEAWVLHGSPAWSQAHVNLDPADAGEQLLDAFRADLGGVTLETVHCIAHRWLYALPTSALPETCLFDEALRVVACGDWCGGPRVEGAFLSGLAAAERLQQRTVPRAP